MLYKELTIQYEKGLKSRAAALFVNEASRYACQILIESGNKKVNAKSIMGLLSLEIKQGESIFVLANGKDEKQAINGLSTLVANNFAEED